MYIYIGEGTGNPLQYSCLGNPMDRGAWRATVHGGQLRVGHNLGIKPQHIYLLIDTAYIYIYICMYIC